MDGQGGATPTLATESLPPSHPFSSKEAQRVYDLANEPTDLGKHVGHALEVIEEAFDRFGVDGVALSFNGGKDCTVLIHLLAAALDRRLSSSPSTSTLRLPTVYVRSSSPFPQVEEFVELCRSRYPSVRLVSVEADMKRALTLFLRGLASDGAETGAKENGSAGGAEGSRIKAVFVGTRRGDPHGAPLRIFDPTDKDWPSFVRVHPIIDWSYASIWSFLRRLDVGWCNLYNYGYTSLGSTHNTFPNPHLKDVDRPSGWRPAWELDDEAWERAGRK